MAVTSGMGKTVAPTGVQVFIHHEYTTEPVGAGLPAMRPVQPLEIYNPSSSAIRSFKRSTFSSVISLAANPSM